MASWKALLPANVQEALRDFEALNNAAQSYAHRVSERIGDFGEGMGKPETKQYLATFQALTEELEAVAMEAGKLLGVRPEEWIDSENDIMDSDTWSGAVSQEIRERDLVEEIMKEPLE
jgi:hypothetical protein